MTPKDAIGLKGLILASFILLRIMFAFLSVSQNSVPAHSVPLLITAQPLSLTN